MIITLTTATLIKIGVGAALAGLGFWIRRRSDKEKKQKGEK